MRTMYPATARVLVECADSFALRSRLRLLAFVCMRTHAHTHTHTHTHKSWWPAAGIELTSFEPTRDSVGLVCAPKRPLVRAAHQHRDIRLSAAKPLPSPLRTTELNRNGSDCTGRAKS